MKLVLIKNQQGLVINQGQMEDPTDWLAAQEQLHAFGSDGDHTIEIIDISPSTLDLVHEQRAKEYPSLDELADALVHQRMGDGGTAFEAYLQKCIAIKAKYPKSE